MTRNITTSRLITIAVFAALGLLIVCGLFACFFALIASPTSTAPQSAARRLTPTAQPLNLLTFEETQKQQDNLTDLQWQEYRNKLIGKQIIDWHGKVNNVREGVFGGYYYVEVDMPGNDFLHDVTLYLDKDIALSLKKDQQITFSGIVKSTDTRIIQGGFATEFENVTIR